MDSGDAQLGVEDVLRDIQQTQTHLLAAVEALSDRVGPALGLSSTSAGGLKSVDVPFPPDRELDTAKTSLNSSEDPALAQPSVDKDVIPVPLTASPPQRSGLTSRIILT